MMAAPSLEHLLADVFVVPFIRTTQTAELASFRAAITPSAIVSHRMMPPKMLTRIPFTAGFFNINLNASVTFLRGGAAADVEKVRGSAEIA